MLKPILDKPLITIGITSYNSEATIARAIYSALSQTWSHKEIIIVDDRSTDNTIEIIKKIISKHPELKLIQNSENMGYPFGLNKVIEHAKGDFIAFFDSDDTSTQDRLEKQFLRYINYEEKSKHKNDILCYSNREVQKVNGDKSHCLAIGRETNEPYGNMVADYLLFHDKKNGFSWGEFGSCTLFARKSVFLNIGKFDENFRRCAEWDLAVRHAFKDGHFISVNLPLVNQHKTKAKYKSGKKPLIFTLKLKRKYKEYLSEQNKYYLSLILSYARFYSFRKNIVLTNFFLLLAYLISPKRVFINLLRKRNALKT